MTKSKCETDLLDLQSCAGSACPGVVQLGESCAPALLCPRRAVDLLWTSSSHPASPSAGPCCSHVDRQEPSCYEAAFMCLCFDGYFKDKKGYGRNAYIA